MKSILIVLDSLTGGGAEKVLLDLLKSLTGKYKIDILLLRKEGVYLEEVEKLVENLYFILEKRNKKYDKNFFIKNIIRTYRGIKLFLYSKNIIKILKNKYDVEIAFLEGPSTEFIANRKTRAKKISWVHIDLKKSRKKSTLKKERKYYEKMDKIVAVSKDTKQALEEVYPDLKTKMNLIYNPILKDEIRKKSLELNLENKNKKLQVLSIGRLDYQKGFDELLEVHKKLLNEGLDYELTIIGEGKLKEELQQYICEHKLEENTFLLGFQKNPYPFIKKCDLFVVSSRYEGFSLVLAEAIVLGKPIISTKCSGPLELLDNGKYGLLVEVGNLDSLEQSIKNMILDKNLREKYIKLSEERSNFFQVGEVIKNVERLLNEK